MKSLISLQREIKNMAKEYFCKTLFVLTVCIISVHLYIYSTNITCGQGVVRFVNLPEKYSYSQSRPCQVD